ncbi:MAG: reprolysin-like metallopeptidase [Ilumatobacteraceae bacterium]
MRRQADASRRRPGRGPHPTRPVAAVLVAATLVAGAASPVADRPAAADAASVVEFDDATAPEAGPGGGPGGGMAPVVEESMAASPRSRLVDVDASALLAQLAGDSVTFQLFDDVAVVFGDRGALTVGVDGNATWSGTTATATATLSFADDGVRGSIQTTDTSYSIVPVAAATHLLFEEGRSFPPTEEPLVPPAEPAWANDAPVSSDTVASGSSGAGQLTAPVAADDGAPVVRVLTVFDDMTSAYFGGDTNAVAELSTTIDEVNAAYARSHVDLVMQSAAIDRAGYVSTQAATTELNRLTNPADGFLDGLHQRRDAVGADLVVFVTPLGASVGGPSCGQAWIPQGAPSDHSFGFAVVDPSCARGNLTFAHETGHNLGADHGPSGGRLGYNNGFINLAGGYRTIMAYAAVGCSFPCRRVPFFSSPTVQYNGQPTGSSTQDNARVLGEVGPSVAAYRAGGVVTPPACGPPTGTSLVPSSPARLFDSRGPNLTVDGLYSGAGPRPAGSITEVQVTGRGCVPIDATGVVLNVTAVQARAAGYASVFPCGEPVPTASNLNFAAGQNVPNAVIAKVGAGGKVCVFAEVPFDLLVDVNGYVPAGSTVGSTTPARLLDSRTGGGTIDGQLAGIGQRTTGSVTEVTVAGRGGVPADASAVVLNVTVVQAGAAGFASVFPCGEALPNASNLNFAAGETMPNAVVAKVGAGGKVCVFAEVPLDLLVDVNGFVPSGSTVGSLAPARLFDSRADGTTVDGALARTGRRGAGSITEVLVAGRGGVPADARAVILNVTAVQADAAGYVSVFPCGEALPNASNLNFAGGQTVPNAAIAKVGAGGTVCLFAEQPTHLLVDVNGFVGR